MKERNLEHEKKIRAYIFSFDFETHKEICKNINVSPKINDCEIIEINEFGINDLNICVKIGDKIFRGCITEE